MKNQDFQKEASGNHNISFMKRLPEIVSICAIITGLLASGTIVKRPDEAVTRHLPLSAGIDTTGLAGSLKVEKFNLEIIPPSSGVQFYKAGIVFLSNTRDEGKMLPKHVSFGTNEAYTALIRDTVLGLHMLFSPTASFSYPCEALTFSTDFKTMYFTMIAKKEKKEKIYRADYRPDAKGEAGWVPNASPLEFCTGNFIYTHPALSSDGKIMIFASDMDGTVGALDLFIVRRDGEKWSRPENLGKLINTDKDECYPFLDQDNNLYFSSDGLPGIGGFDIFTCKFDGEKWEKPVNLTNKINSEEDDIAFSIEKNEGKIAFYTRRQKSRLEDIKLLKVSLTRDKVANNPLTISYIFNGKAGEKTELLASKPDETSKPVVQETSKASPAEVKKAVKTEGKKTPSNPAAAPAAPGAKVVIIKPTSEIPEELKNVVVYRIQFLSTGQPRKETQVLINGVPYKTFEYFYLGMYRYTIGEFRTLAPATELQNICRKSGFPQAFVAAFKNDTRSLDLSTFK
jgi:hypothetical protein